MLRLRPLLIPCVALLVACGDKDAASGTSATSASGGSSGTDSGSGGTTAGGTSAGSGSATSSATATTSTSGGSTGGTTTTAGTSTSGGGFVQEPDSGSTNECDPKTQDCPDGEKCSAWANDGSGTWNENKCVPVSGSGVAGDPCTVEGGGVSGIDDCAVGHICLNTDMNGMGVCVKFCTGMNTDCDPGYICAIYNDGVLPICLDECDPLVQDCPMGQACIDTPNGNFICFTDASGSAGAAGDPCPPEDGENSCDPGMWCGGPVDGCQAPKCCTPYCDLSGADPCGAPNECISFYGDPASAPPQYMDVGVCILP
jgi:hypothetical protein